VGNQSGGSFSQPGGIGNYQIGGGFAGKSQIYIDYAHAHEELRRASR
jgi:hypothetical protein